MARRFDTTRLARRPEFTPNGWLKADATLTRCGVFKYRNADGSVRRELRHPDDVFNQDSLATLELVPVTDRHPPEELLDGDTTKSRQVGQVGDSIRRDGGEVLGRILVTDSEMVRQVAAKQVFELSCGYECRMDAEAGTFDGEAYDVRQRDIRYNHVAIVKVGRAGSARIHLDAGDAMMVPEADEPAEKCAVCGGPMKDGKCSTPMHPSHAEPKSAAGLELGVE